MEITERELKALWNAAYVIQEEGGLSCPALKRALKVLTKAIWTPRQKAAVLQMDWVRKPRLSAER